jgi:hypothetical protein
MASPLVWSRGKRNARFRLFDAVSETDLSPDVRRLEPAIHPDRAATPLKESKMRTPNRPARGIVAVLAATLAITIVIAPVAAATPQQVQIVSDMTFNPDGPNFGDFAANGKAVDSGLICARGTVLDTGIVFGGFQSGRGFQVLVRKTFTCDDGSGTIFVKIQVHASTDGTESFTWIVQGGTGSYMNLRGSGDGTTVPLPGDPEPGNINSYSGFLVG